jgi:hypothetical protein
MTITCGAGSTGTIPGQVDVNATVISGDNCPSITSGAVAPAVTSVGASIAVSAAASDPDAADTLSYTWTDGVGGPTLATGNNTSVVCPSSGTHHIILVVADNHTPSCSKSVDLPVNCVAVATGTGGTAGTGTGGVAGSGTGGSTGGTAGTGTGGSTGGTAGTGTGGQAGGTGGMMVDVWAECGACELGSSNVNCAAYYISVDGSGSPFGCDGLAGGAAEIQACKDLSHCILAQNCSTNSTGSAAGDNAVEGCYCGPAPETSASCLSGTGIAGLCAAAYHTAAIADPASGLTASSTEAAFAMYIATAAFDPTTAVGMADNLMQCAIDAPCKAANQCGGI